VLPVNHSLLRWYVMYAISMWLASFVLLAMDELLLACFAAAHCGYACAKSKEAFNDRILSRSKQK